MACISYVKIKIRFKKPEHEQYHERKSFTEVQKRQCRQHPSRLYRLIVCDTLMFYSLVFIKKRWRDSPDFKAGRSEHTTPGTQHQKETASVMSYDNMNANIAIVCLILFYSIHYCYITPVIFLSLNV